MVSYDLDLNLLHSNFLMKAKLLLPPVKVLCIILEVGVGHSVEQQPNLSHGGYPKAVRLQVVI